MNERILKVREICGLNQEAFAERLGITKSAISGYETGRREPTMQIIKAICREFNINESWLQTGNGEMLNASNDELGALADRYNLSDSVTAFIEELVTAPQGTQDALIELIVKTADRIHREAEPQEDVLNDTAAAEAAYRQALRTARHTDSGASSTTEGTEIRKEA